MTVGLKTNGGRYSCRSCFKTFPCFTYGVSALRRYRGRLMDVYCTKHVLFLLFIPFAYAINTTGYNKVRDNAAVGSLVPEFTVVSLLECSKICTTVASCEGFNFFKAKRRQCAFLTSNDVMFGVLMSLQDTYVYIKTVHVAAFELAQMNQTTTSPSTTPTSPTQSVTDISTTLSLTVTSTTTTSMPTQLVTSTATTSTPTQPVTSTTTTSTPTQPVTSTTTTPTPTQPVTSTTTTTSTAPPTTSLTTSTTATTSPLFCATALLCMPTAIYVINNNNVRTYNDVSGLLLGSLVNVQALAAGFQSSSDIVGAYYDGTKINLIIGSGKVHVYSNLLVFEYETTWTAHFSNNVGTNIDDVIQKQNSDLYIFDGTTLNVISGGSLSTKSLGNNGNKNPYKAGNHNSRPLTIDAACEDTANPDQHVFISENILYTFTFSSSTWQSYGSVC